MTDTSTKNKYPSAFYAAAGVGDLVYEQLRKLQDKAVAFGGEQAPQWKRKVAEFGTKVDADKVRESVVVGTQVAAETATKVYSTLVARGEKAFRADTAHQAAGKTTAKPAEKTAEQGDKTAPTATVKKTAPVVKKAPSAGKPTA